MLWSGSGCSTVLWKWENLLHWWDPLWLQVLNLRGVEGKQEVTWMTFEHKVREKTKPEGTPLVRVEYPGSLKLMDWQKARAYSQELRTINQWIHTCVCSLVTRQASKICCKRLQLLMCLESSDNQHQTTCSTTCPQQASNQGQDHWNHYRDKYLKTRITKYQARSILAKLWLQLESQHCLWGNELSRRPEEKSALERENMDLTRYKIGSPVGPA